MACAFGPLARLDARLAASPTMTARFAEEQQLWRPVPEPFVAAATTEATVSPRALVRVARASYSVPCRWAGLDVVVHTGPAHVTLVGPADARVSHPRKRFGESAVDYRHYLSQLARKPQRSDRSPARPGRFVSRRPGSTDWGA